MKRYIFWVMLLSMLSLTAAPVSAATLAGTGLAPGPSIASRDPGGFHYVARGGAIINDSAKLINTQPDVKRIRFNIVEATVMADNRLTCSAVTAPTVAWARLSSTESNVEGASSQLIPFSLMIPGTFKAGELQACIVAQEISGMAQGTIPLSTRVAMRLSVTPPGARPPRVFIDNLSAAMTDRTISPSIRIRNIEPVTSLVSFRVKLDGKLCQLRQSDAKAKAMLPATRQTITPPPIDRPFWGGFCHLHVAAQSRSANYALMLAKQSSTTSQTISLFVMPSAAAIVLILFTVCIVIGLVGLTYWAYKKPRR